MSRSLQSREGVVLYSQQGVGGATPDVATLPANPLGICGFNASDDGDFRPIFTVGNRNLFKNKAGIYKVEFEVQIEGLAGIDVVTDLCIRRANGEMPWITWGFGSDDGTTKEAWQVQDAKVGSWDFSLDGGGFANLSIHGIGGQITNLTTLVADAGDPKPMMSYEAILTLNGSAFEVKGLNWSVNENLNPESVVRGAAVASARQRRWDYLCEGNEEITGSFRLARVNSKDFQAPCPGSQGDAVLTLTNACDATTFAFTLTDLEFLTQRRDMPRSGEGSFDVTWNAKGIAAA